MTSALLRGLARLVATVLLGTYSLSSAQITVENFESGTVVHQAAALLRGRSSSKEDVRILREGVEVFRAPVVAGRFIGLVELREGKNTFRLSAGKLGTQLVLEARAPQDLHRLRVVYVTAADGNTDYLTQRKDDPQNYAAKLDTLAKCLQAFTAESMRDAGFGRRTFQLETDDRGRVTVHTLRHPKSRSELQALADNELYGAMHAFAIPHFDPGREKVLLIMGFSGYDAATKKPLAHTALGGGALGVFSNLSMHSWPDSLADVPRALTSTERVDTSRVFEDVGLRDLHRLASTTMGAVLHEMGHTFGLPHTSDPRCIMSRGFDHLYRALTAGEPQGSRLVPHPNDSSAYWSPAFALRLAHSPWFRTDPEPPASEPGPRYVQEEEGKAIVVEAPAGIAGVSVQTGDPDPTHALVLSLGKDAATTARFEFDALRKEHGLAEPLILRVFDRAHRELVIDERLIANTLGYLRHWQIGTLEHWDRSVPELPQERVLRQWSAELARQSETDTTPPGGTPFQSADLHAHFGGARESSVLLRAEVRSKDARRAVLHFGGDDGVRIWVNGRLVLDRVELAVFPLDSLGVDVDLRRGDNEILVQSFQGGGGWGFSVRLEP